MQAGIKKAVFPVAGLGTRFLPATKANPKEMLPIVDKPLIQYAVEEAIAAGVTELVFVTSSSKRAIEDHFDHNYELEQTLIKKDKQALLDIVRNILPKGISSVYIRQPRALGLGHAVLCAKNVIGNEPFAVLLADDLIDGGKRYCLQKMLDIHIQTAASVVAVEEIELDQTNKYGIVAIEKEQVSQLKRIHHFVEKPDPKDAPSNLAAVGRYILTPEIFAMLEHTTAGAGGEIQLTDAIAALLTKQTVYSHILSGIRYDCGSKVGYVKATIQYALKHPEIGNEVLNYLRHLPEIAW